MLIDQEIDRVMHTYGKEYSKHDRDILNKILQSSKKRVNAFSESVRIVPMHAILLSILLEQESQLQSLLSKLSGDTKNAD